MHYITIHYIALQYNAPYNPVNIQYTLSFSKLTTVRDYPNYHVTEISEVTKTEHFKLVTQP